MKTLKAALASVDPASPNAKSLEVKVVANEQGIFVNFEGYGEAAAEPKASFPLLIENRDGVPVIVIWGDISNQDPTHVISLAGADIRLDKYADVQH